jgi:hypothetical protein
MSAVAHYFGILDFTTRNSLHAEADSEKQVIGKINRGLARGWAGLPATR